MVYCGKPSMGCRTCRERRIKCDETRPVCNQCTKSRRHCSGYRSNFDILHRDETHKTANRHKRTTEKKAAKRSGEAAGGAILQFEHVTVGAPSSSASASASTPASAPAARRKIKKEDSPPAVSPPSTSSPAYSSSSSPSSSSSSASSSPAAQQQYDFSYSQPSSSTALVTTASTSSSTSSSSSFELGFPSTALAVPIDQHASHYFASHFIMLPGQRGQAYGHLEYLVPLLQTETSPSSPFQLAYSACGLAAMSNRERANHTDLTELSYLQHARASTAIRKALADPVQCRSDATLASVLLLSFFEKITATKEMGGLLAWRTHIVGAVQIVSARGREMFNNKYSTQLFSAVRLEIIARTLSSGTSPAMGVNWWMPESEACDPIGTRFQRFSLEVSDLRAEVTRLMSVLTRNNDGLDIMLEMLRKCQDMDRRIATWLERLDDEYQPQPLYWEEDWTSGLFLGNGEGAGAGGGANALLKQASVFPGRVDVYRDLITACLWNGQRSTRIILGSLIIRVAAWICSPADHRSTPEYATAMGTMQEAIAGIISSVPFMLGTFSTQPQQSLQPLQQLQQQQAVSAGHFLCGADEQAKMVGGLMVSWPLSTVRTCDFTTDEQRLWTVGRLNYISNDLGIRYADAFAGAKIRFPSMLMRRDGLMTRDDPLKEIRATGFDRMMPVR